MSDRSPARLWENDKDGDPRAELAKEISRWIVWLARYGGSDGGGVTRLLYDETWQAARLALLDRMTGMGLAVRADRVGNTFGKLEGSNPQELPIGVGSHLDTVRDGGMYDGAYGIIAALIAVEGLREAYGQPKRSIEIAAFCEEEGSRFPLAYWGSGSLTGARSPADILGLADPGGVGFAEAMRGAGFGREDQPEPVDTAWGAFIELHIEQGPVLEAAGEAIGVVDAIVGQKRYAFRLFGKANHAGTTPMGKRSDALAGAAVMVSQLELWAEAAGAPLVATVGRLEVYPNTPNVVPGQVNFTVDIRHPDGEVLDAFGRDVADRFMEIAESRGLGLSTSLWVDTLPVPLDSSLTKLAAEAAAGRGLACRMMPSGAGHDAQMLAAVCPTALIFVPSRDGVSHSLEEFTEPEQLADGVMVLADLLYKLAYEE